MSRPARRCHLTRAAEALSKVSWNLRLSGESCQPWLQVPLHFTSPGLQDGVLLRDGLDDRALIERLQPILTSEGLHFDCIERVDETSKVLFYGPLRAYTGAQLRDCVADQADGGLSSAQVRG